MRITITIEAGGAEAAALIARLRELFGDRVAITVEGAPPAPVEKPEPPAGTSISTAPVEITPPRPPGRGQILRNPDLTGDPVVYGEWQVGPAEWKLLDRVGVSRPGGETQAVRCEPKRPENSFEGYDRYLNPAYGNTAVEMGGSWRTFEWAFQQSDVDVRAGYVYELAAVFHPLIKTRLADSSEVFMSAAQAGDWMANLEWRWVVRAQGGDVLAADDWRDGGTLGTTTFDLPPDRPHCYAWRWTAPQDARVSVALEFRNRWALAMTRVWVHRLTCVEQ